VVRPQTTNDRFTATDTTFDRARLLEPMNMMKHPFGRFTADDLGQDLVEYALLLSFVALATMAGMRALGSGINAKYTNIATALSDGSSVVPAAGAASPAGGASGGGNTGTGVGSSGNNGNHGTGNNGNGNGGKKP
jgi:Flp pilus assembly pilin Flp